MPSLFLRAKRLLSHPEELRSTLAKALAKAYSKRAVLFRVFEDFLLLFRFVKAWVKGEYRNVPKRTVFWAVLAILYFLSPVDVLPDFLPGGYIDDIAVIAFILERIKGDLEGFADWEKKRRKGT